MRVRELFDDALTRIRHERDDIHYIGEALPAPSQVATTLSTGTPASVGGSSVPAREDHVHALDVADLEAAIDALIGTGDTTIVNQTYVQNFTYNTYLGDAEDPSDGPTGAFYNEIVFSFDGPLEVSVSPYWPVPWGAYVYEVATQMNTPDSVGVRLVTSGVGTMWSATLSSATAVVNHAVSPEVAITRNQKIRAEITSIGGGAAENLTIVMRYLWWDLNP